MKKTEYIKCLFLFLAVMLTAIVLPDDVPYGALPAVHVPDRQCNSCHVGVTAE